MTSGAWTSVSIAVMVMAMVISGGAVARGGVGRVRRPDGVASSHRARWGRQPTGRLHWRRVIGGKRVRRCGTFVAGALVVLLVGPFGLAVTLGLVVTWRRVAPILAERRHRRDVAAALPDAFDLFILSVQAGRTPRQAVVDVAHRAPLPVRPAFASVLARLDRGAVLADALTALRGEVGGGATALVDLVGTADRYGLPLGPVLVQLADQARADRRRAADAAARTLPIRLSFPLVACTLPSFVALAIAPAVMAALSSLQATPW